MTRLTMSLAIILTMVALAACDTQETPGAGVGTETAVAEAPTPTATPISQPVAVATCESSNEPPAEPVQEWTNQQPFYAAFKEGYPWGPLGFPGNTTDGLKLGVLDQLVVPELVSGDAQATFDLKLRNRYDETVSFGLRGAPAYDFAVMNMDGEVVWIYSDGVEVEPVESSLELEPGELDEWTVTWDLNDTDGQRVEDGLYVVMAIIYRELVYVETAQRFMQIGAMPPLEDALDIRLSAECGESVALTLEVTNVTDQVIKIFTGQDVDHYVVFDSDLHDEGSEVWTWRHGLIHSNAGREMWVPPGATNTFTGTWELEDLDWNPVEPGIYDAQARFRGTRFVDTTGGVSSEERLWSNIVRITVTE